MSELTDEHVRQKAAELILTGKTLESAEDINDEVRNCISELLVRTAGKQRKLTPEHQNLLLSVLGQRMSLNQEHYNHPKDINFSDVKKALEANPALLYSVAMMEGAGGMPDIIAVEPDVFVFGDCSAESPNRRGLTYDRVTTMAKGYGVEIMTKEVYCKMQEIGKFDLNSWSWLATPDDVKKFGHALGGTRYRGSCVDIQQYDTCTCYEHAGWRGMLKVPRV